MIFLRAATGVGAVKWRKKKQADGVAANDKSQVKLKLQLRLKTMSGPTKETTTAKEVTYQAETLLRFQLVNLNQTKQHNINTVHEKLKQT